MMSGEMKTAEIKWIENQLIPKILKHLGKSSDSARWEISFPKDTIFLSYVCFLNLIFQSSEENDANVKEDTMNLVIKKPPIGSVQVTMMSMDKQFHNEILFYKKVARGNTRFPRCIYTAEGKIDETVIVIENITSMGYKVCDDAYDLPLEYVLAAVEEMGRFQAMTYTMKEQEPDEFKRIVNDIQESRFLVEGTWMSGFLNNVATRPIEWLRKNNCEGKFCDILEKHLANAYNEIMLECVKPVEPLATLCHGDFTRNNIYFRKNDGKMEGMLFDFAVILYTSPAIDIATFLYLNCSKSDRIEKFHVIFKAYHKALIEHLQDNGVKDLEKYSYEKFLTDYKRRASFGYMIAIFFLPVIRGIFPCSIDEYYKDPEEGQRQMKIAGGEAMTEEFAKMILELRDTGCFDHLFH